MQMHKIRSKPACALALLSPNGQSKANAAISSDSWWKTRARETPKAHALLLKLAWLRRALMPKDATGFPFLCRPIGGWKPETALHLAHLPTAAYSTYAPTLA